MKERPIVLKAHEVRAILEGRQTMLRRVVKPQPHESATLGFVIPKPNAKGSCAQFRHVDESGAHSHELTVHCPYGMPGDRLWVRETWGWLSDSEEPPYRTPSHDFVSWRATYDNPDSSDMRWKPSIHMPRWASRITLEITEVRVKRLQDISPADARAEGVACEFCRGIFGDTHSCECVGEFRELWESINGPGSWDANPYVWAISFKQVEA